MARSNVVRVALERIDVVVRAHLVSSQANLFRASPGALTMATFRHFTEEQLAAAPSIDSELLHLLQDGEVHDDLINLLRVSRISTVKRFALMAGEKEEARAFLRDLAQVGTPDGPANTVENRIQLGLALGAWQTATERASAFEKAAAAARAHGEAVDMGRSSYLI